MRFLTYILFSGLISSYVHAQQAGTVDTGFNITDNGVYPTDINDYIRSAHIYPNGDYLIAGNFTMLNGQPVNRIVRITNNGVPVTWFNPGTGPNGNIKDMAVLTNGKIVIVGEFDSYDGVPVDSIALLNENGSINSGFNLSQSPIGIINAVSGQSNGDILICGIYNYPASASGVERISQNGVIDTSFSMGSPADFSINNLFVDEWDNIFPVGQFTTIGSHITSGFARLGPQGQVDTLYSIAPEYGDGTIQLVINNDSSVVAGGSYSTTNGNVIYGYFKVLPDGNIDSTFQDSPGWAHCQSIAKDPNGGYYAYMNNNQYKTVRHLLPDGSIDPNFEEYTYAGNGNAGAIREIKVEPFTNKLVLCGYNLSRRFNDGTKDETFLSPMGINGDVHVVKTLPDGKLLIGGDFSGYNNYSRNGIVRVLNDGSIDLSFDPGRGAVTGVDPVQTLREVLDIETQNDGKILVGGGFIRFNAQPHNRLVRLNPNGEVDTSFNIGNGFNNIIREITLQPDGKILVGGDFTSYDQGGPNQTGCNRIARLNADGSFDTNFQVTPGANSNIRSLIVLDNGQIIAGGNFSTFHSQIASKIARINADGSFDNTLSTGYGCNGTVLDLTIDSAGLIYAVGTATMYDSMSVNRLFRIFSNGNPDTTFIVDTIFYPSTLKQIEIQPNGSLLVTGQYYDGWGSTQIGKLFPNGALDTNFFLDGPTGIVNYFDLFADGSIAVGGTFSQFAGVTKRRITKLYNDIPYDSCLYFNAGINSVSNISCLDTAEVLINVYNGTPPYYYSWNNGGFQLGDSIFFTNVAGIHYISVTDSLDCVFSTGFLINGPTEMNGFDNTVQLISTTFTPGVTSTLMVDAYNDGCVPSSGQVVLVLDSLVSFIASTPVPDIINGDSLIWNFTSIAYDSSHITPTVTVITDTTALIGDSLNFNISILPVTGDSNPLNNIKDYSFEVSASYDPNDKQAFPVGDCIPHYVPMGQKMTYTVRFQNTGTANAINVHIDDSISSFLNLSSIRVVAASDEMFTEVHSGNMLRFVFNDIQLPDSASNPQGSIGYVIFEIDQDSSCVFDESLITNQSAIYFDYNAPVITNQVYNTVQIDNYESSITNMTLAECDSVLWNGQYYSNSGLYSYTMQNTDGCDSTIYLDLSLVYSIDTTLFIDGIDSVSVNGVTYYTSDTYNQILATEAGCDSILILNVNIGYSGLNGLSHTKILVFPNPTERYLTIQGGRKDDIVLIVDQRGKIIEKTIVSGDLTTLDLNDAEPGVYSLLLQREGFVSYHKIVLLK